MSNTRRVLVLGASGMIGRAVRDLAFASSSLELVPASHRKLPGFLTVPFAHLTEPSRWMELLLEHRIDAVVNCVGIWSASASDFERVQYTVPTALFAACQELRCQVVHISALGFSPDSVLPYASTKARADRYLLQHCSSGSVVYPSLIFGSDGQSSRFFLNLAALPVQVDFGFSANLQPVHVNQVARAILDALEGLRTERHIECAGSHPITVNSYFDALRTGMGLGRAPIRMRLPWWIARSIFAAGELLGAQFVNHQTWTLMLDGTASKITYPHALPYQAYAGRRDLSWVRQTQLYWFARLGVAFLWIWTAWVTAFEWPQSETLSWLGALAPALSKPSWLYASSLLDAMMGLLALVGVSVNLWRFQFALTAIYSIGLAISLRWVWFHPFGPLTKNLCVLASLAFLALHEKDRAH